MLFLVRQTDYSHTTMVVLIILGILAAPFLFYGLAKLYKKFVKSKGRKEDTKRSATTSGADILGQLPLW